MLTQRKLLLVLSAIAFSSIATAVYSYLVPNEYEVTARVVVHRSPIEVPNQSNEDSKNRWIWVRDGYAIKDSLVSQRFLSTLLVQNSVIQERLVKFQKEQRSRYGNENAGAQTKENVEIHFVEELKKHISVDFLGGDAFSFVLKAEDPSGAVAKELVSEMIRHLESLVVKDTHDAYGSALIALRREARKPTSEEHKAFLMDTYRGLLASSLLFDASASRLVEVVQAPAIPFQARWPQFEGLALIAVLAGLALALAIELITRINFRAWGYS